MSRSDFSDKEYHNSETRLFALKSSLLKSRLVQSRVQLGEVEVKFFRRYIA